MNKATVRVGIAVVCSIFLARCASGPRVTPYLPNAQEQGWTQNDKGALGLPSGEERAFRSIQQAHLAGDSESVRKQTQVFEKSYPKSKAIARVFNYLGLAELQERRALQASHAFRKAISRNREYAFKPYLLYNLAACQFEQGMFADAGKTLSEVSTQSMPPVSRFKFYYLRGMVQLKLNDADSSIEDFFQAGSQISHSGGKLSNQQAALEKNIELALEKITDPARLNPTRLEKLLTDYPNHVLHESYLYYLAGTSIRLSKKGLAENYLRQFMIRFPQSRFYAEAVDQLRTLQNQTLVDAQVVGVLLPMSGRLSKFGQQSLKAIELGFHVFDADSKYSTPITLIVEDSGETPEEALEALENLYYRHQVVAVIGPLLSRGIDKVTMRAQELGLPLLSLAPQEGAKGDFVFQMQPTTRDQAYSMAQFALQKTDAKRFAILYPRDKFGQEYTQHFWDSVNELGGEVTAAATYNPGETDFRTAVDQLVGLAHPEARRLELEALAEIRKQKNITKRTSKTQRYFELSPIVQFDALFIPDEARAVGQILPTFAYRDVENIRFLGIGTWNSKDLLRRAQGFTDGALFVDTFNTKATTPETVSFASLFSKQFEETPSAQEAVAFDAASILYQILARGAIGSGPVKRSDVREQLTAVTDFPGSAGKIRYEAGRFVRFLKIFMIQNGQIGEAPTPVPPMGAKANSKL